MSVYKVTISPGQNAYYVIAADIAEAVDKTIVSVRKMNMVPISSVLEIQSIEYVGEVLPS